MKKKNNLDKATLEIEENQTLLKGLVENSGWKLAKMKLIKRIANMLSLNNPELSNLPADVLLQVITAKRTAADELLGWLKEIEGDVAQLKGNQENQQLVQEVTEGMLYSEE